MGRLKCSSNSTSTAHLTRNKTNNHRGLGNCEREKNPEWAFHQYLRKLTEQGCALDETFELNGTGIKRFGITVIICRENTSIVCVYFNMY